MKVLAITGPSGAGKTTLIRALIEHLAARGERVAAIKHTHHELNEENRGDTAAFRKAGAEPVILAGDKEAVVFLRAGIERVPYAEPRELLDVVAREFVPTIVLIEGFKSTDAWRRIDANTSVAEALGILDRMAAP